MEPVEDPNEKRLNKNLKLKTCPACTVITNIKNNFCETCNYKFLIKNETKDISEAAAVSNNNEGTVY